MSDATTIQAPEKAKRQLTFRDSPWFNAKLIVGAVVIIFAFSLEFIGPVFWDTSQVGISSDINKPPSWYTSEDVTPGLGQPTVDHPLGTDNRGRDILAVVLVGTPRSLKVGFIAAGIGMLIGIILGFSSGYLGGWVDAVIQVLADAFITIPALAVLIVIASLVNQLEVGNMALILSLFAWSRPTRYIRAQILTMRERGYVQMAQFSGASSFDIMFKEMLPNLLPYLAAAFIGTVSANILAATSLEALGLGPTNLPTLGMTIYNAILGAALFRGMWWWWGIPIIILVIIFISLFLINIGLDEIANPRLRGIQD